MRDGNRESRGRLAQAPVGQERRRRTALAERVTVTPGGADLPRAIPAGATPVHVLLPAEDERGLDLEAVTRAVAAGASVRVEVLVGQIPEDDERFLDTLAALDEVLAEAPEAQIAIVEPTAATPEVAARGALLAEVAYRHGARRPVPIVHQLVPPCNNQCAHCAVSELRDHRPGGEPAEVERALEELAARGEDRVMFGIAEISLHPDFLGLLATAREHGFRAIYVATNGRSFAAGDLAARAVAAGATHFQVSLHGADAATHDGLTGVPGSFDEAVAGIRALVATGAQVISNTVVCRPTAERLEALLDLVADLGVRFALLGQLPIQGRAKLRVDELLLPLATAAPRMLAAAVHGEARGLRVGLAGVPYCFAPGAERFLGVDDLMSVYDVDPSEGLLLKVPFVRSRPCVRCAAYAICRGVSEEYLRLRGSDELQPLSGPRATSRPHAALADFYAPPAAVEEEPA